MSIPESASQRDKRLEAWSSSHDDGASISAARDELLGKQPLVQDSCPLFSMLPAEVRAVIFAYILVDFPDPNPDSQYAATTCYSRPAYFSRRKTDARLLRTCRAVYRECWFMPVTLREQTRWLTASNRAPPWSHMARRDMKLADMGRHMPEGKVEIENLRVFAQMYKLEEGNLANLLMTPGLHPRFITLTIRHTDWWFWEDDEPLRFDGGWIEQVSDRMSSTTDEFRIELESLERKKDQVDSIARQMRQRWFFKRSDGTLLFPQEEDEDQPVSRWSGPSTWHKMRWIRDETTEDTLDYYIATVTFRTEFALRRMGGGTVSDALKQAASSTGGFDVDKMKLVAPGRRMQLDWPPYIDMHLPFYERMPGEPPISENGSWEDDDSSDAHAEYMSQDDFTDEEEEHEGDEDQDESEREEAGGEDEDERGETEENVSDPHTRGQHPNSSLGDPARGGQTSNPIMGDFVFESMREFQETVQQAHNYLMSQERH